MTDRRRKGSLGWYHNSSRGKRALIPVETRFPHLYGVKVGMTQQMVEDTLTPISLIQLVPLEKISGSAQWKLDLESLDAKSTLRKNALRQINSEAITYEDLKNQVLESELLDITGLTKGKGTSGARKRRKIKLQKRKARGGVTRKVGSLGIRRDAKVEWTRPFSGKHGFSRRTLFNLENLGTIQVKNFTSLRYYIKQGTILAVKGSIVGPIGRLISIRKAVRK